MNERQFRNTVTRMTFFLTVLVIYAHAVNIELFLGPEGKGHPAGIAELLLGGQLSQAAVPGFFFLSGILFFRNYDLKQTGRKWAERIRGLVIPYLLWNLLYYIAYLVGTRFPGLSGVVGREVVEFSPAVLFRAVMFYEYNYSFWYLFQLILLTIISPLLYLAAERDLTFAAAEILLMVCILLRIDVIPLNADACFYYLTAAGITLRLRPRNWKARFARIREKERTYRDRLYQDALYRELRYGRSKAGWFRLRERIPAYVYDTGRADAGNAGLKGNAGSARIAENAASASGASGRKGRSGRNPGKGNGRRLSRRSRMFLRYGAGFLAAAFLFHLTALRTANDLLLVLARLLTSGGLWLAFCGLPLEDPPSYMYHTFLIYAIHFAPVRLINKTAAVMLPGNAIAALILYLVMPALVVLIAECFTFIMARVWPGFYALLTGGRV